MNKTEILLVREAMEELTNMPCGAIGAVGPTLYELDDYAEKHGQPIENDAMYHCTQRAWRLLERVLP